MTDDRLLPIMGGPIIDASLVAAPRQRNTQEEKDAIKAGKTASEIWPDQPAKAAQKDTDARPQRSADRCHSMNRMIGLLTDHGRSRVRRASPRPTGQCRAISTSRSSATASRTVSEARASPRSHISIDAEHGFIRRQKTTDAAAHEWPAGHSSAS